MLQCYYLCGFRRLKDELAKEKASNAQLTKTKQDLQSRIETLQRELESKSLDLEGIMSVSFELTNKLKYVNCKDQRADDVRMNARTVIWKTTYTAIDLYITCICRCAYTLHVS